MIKFLDSFYVLFRWSVFGGIQQKNNNILAVFWKFCEDLFPVLKGKWLFPILLVLFLFPACISVVSIYQCKKTGRKAAKGFSILTLIMNTGAILSILSLFVLAIVFYRQIAMEFRFFRGLGGTFVNICSYYILICLFPAIICTVINLILCATGSSRKTNMPAMAGMPPMTGMPPTAGMPPAAGANMPVCPQCKRPIAANMQFCAYCGSRLQ